MNAKVTFRQETLSQEGTVGKILRFIQDKPNFVRSTNVTLLTDMICEYSGKKTNTVRMTINKMINNQMLLRYGGKKHARFMINYYQKDIPGYILERAPQDIQDKVKAMKDNLNKDQYIDNAGCVVTKGKKQADEEEDVKVEKEEDVKSEEEEDAKEVKVVDNKEEAPQETNKQDVVVPVEIKDDSKGMNLTITLNLTINR